VAEEEVDGVLLEEAVIVLEVLVVKPLILVVKLLLGHLVIQQEYGEQYHDLFNS
jgi:hypothetical protein